PKAARCWRPNWSGSRPGWRGKTSRRSLRYRSTPGTSSEEPAKGDRTPTRSAPGPGTRSPRARQRPASSSRCSALDYGRHDQRVATGRLPDVAPDRVEDVVAHVVQAALL